MSTTCLVRRDPDDYDQLCGKQLGDGTTCCVEHAAALARALHDVPALLDDLEVTLSRQDRLGAPGHSRDGTLMWKPAVPDTVWALGNTLTTWARLLAQRNGTTVGAGALSNRPIRGSASDHPRPREGTGGLSGPRCEHTGLVIRHCAHCRRLPDVEPLPDDATPARPTTPRPAPVLGQRGPTALDGVRLAARWLVRNIHLLRRDLEAAEAHGEITDALTQATAACSAPPLRLFVGLCDTWRDVDGDQVQCTEDLYARPDFQAITCPRCLAVHTDTGIRWHQALRRIALYPATAALIARHVGELYGQRIDRKRINQWHTRGQLAPVDHDDDGNPRFRIGAVLELARRRGPDPSQQSEAAS